MPGKGREGEREGNEKVLGQNLDNRELSHLFLLLLEKRALSHHLVLHFVQFLFLNFQILCFDFNRLHMGAGEGEGGRERGHESLVGATALRDIGSKFFFVSFELFLHFVHLDNLLGPPLDLVHLFVFEQSHLSPHFGQLLHCSFLKQFSFCLEIGLHRF
jgi:hypothetical protein